MDSSEPKKLKLPEPVYLGDGVYALFNGYFVILRLHDHLNETGQICLDIGVLDELIKFGKKCFSPTTAPRAGDK